MGKKGWEYRKATWPVEMDNAVHEIFDKKRKPPLSYLRKRWRDGKFENCKIEKDDEYGWMVKPGNGYDFLIKRDSKYNRKANIDNIKFEDLDPDTYFPKEIMDKIIRKKRKKENPETDGVILTDVKCLICLDKTRTHVVPDCFHVVACEGCAKKLWTKTNKKCPVCRHPFTQKLKKLYF